MSREKRTRASAFAVFIAVVLGAVANLAAADVVTLANGDRISGTVTSITGGNVLLQTELFGALTVPAEQVSGISKTEPMQLRTTEGNEVTGTLEVVDDTQVVNTEFGTQPLALADLDRAVENYLNQAVAETLWTTRVDVGYALSTGNSETESSAVNFESILDQGKYQHRAFVNWNQDEADGETTRNQLDAGYGLRRFIGEKWFAAANLGYFKDELKEIDQRITVGLGLGYQFFDTSLSSLSTEFGLTQVFEDLDGESENNPALRWAANYNLWIQPERVEYFYGHEVLTIFDSGRGEVYKANTGIRFALSELWTANLRLDAVHETMPPEGREKTDLIYTVGFGLVF
ncbi:MAG: DUF481 domain-containing protein [Pseudomonadota bacterium]